MAYPFLPVNPSCGTVVINDPCGCSSTITNSGCNSNDPCSTNLTASSTIAYDGPALSCIIAEPCDTLNVILQKIDEIICNLLTQINILTIQINNITTQIINIEGDIINIDNSLDACCNTTTTSTSSSSTTTSTTTIHPCENFSLTNTGVTPVAIIITDCDTGEPEAIILNPGDTNICVITDSPLTVPGTIIVTPNGPCLPPPSSTTTTTSSSTSTSTSSTTTTSTTAIPCECLTFYNGDILDQEISYIDCNGVNQDDIILAGATNQYCGCCGVANTPYVTITIGADCVQGNQGPICIPTTTTSTTILPNCGFTGTADQVPDVTTTTTSSSSSTTTTTTTICIRPSGLITVNYNNSYTYEGTLVDYTGSLIEACDACIFLQNNTPSQETSLFGQSETFAIGQHVYAGLVTYCIDLADGFYLTNKETCQVTQIIDGYIVNILNCSDITTTSTTSSSTSTSTTTSTSTSTTTTTAYPYGCTCMHVTISQTDLDDATGNTPVPGLANNTVYLTSSKFSGCDDSEVDVAYTTAEFDGFCIKTSAINTIQLFYYKNNVPIYFPAIASTYNVLYSDCSVNATCIPA